MNKKLTRLEYGQTRKIMFLLTAFIAAYMLISAVCSGVSNLSTTDTAFILKTILVFISGLLVICTFMMMVKRYYNILFTNEGYARLSLPVANREHLHANLKNAFIWLGSQIVLFFAGLEISDLISKNRVERWGVGNLYPDYLDLYTTNIPGKYIASPKFKAVFTVLIIIIAFVIVAANIYLSFIFTLTVSSYVCGKYNIVQKSGVIFLTGVFMYCIHLLAAQGINKLMIIFNTGFLEHKGFDVFGANELFIESIDKPVVFILFYGITGYVMYRISRSILDKKLDI